MSDLSINEKLEIVIDALEVKADEEFSYDERKILFAELTKSYKTACILNQENNSQLLFNYTEDVLDQVDRKSDLSDIINCITSSGMKLRK